MACYDPPDQDYGLSDKHVVTLKEIEEYCKSVLADHSLPPKACFVAASVIDIIDKNWWRARQ